jgi:hypothetical protein
MNSWQRSCQPLLIALVRWAVPGLALALALCGCSIATYEVNPPVSDKSPPEWAVSLPVYYSDVTPHTGTSSNLADEARLAFKKLRLPIKEGTQDSTDGILCTVIAIRRPEPQIEGWRSVSYISLGLLPWYGDTGQFSLEYAFYLKGKLIKTLHYEVVRHEFNWLITYIPFFWLNSVFRNERDIVAATTYHALNEVKPLLSEVP